MDTKSRYEVIAELEAKKRELMDKRDSMDLVLKNKQRQVKFKNRELEDLKEDIDEFKESMKQRKETINEIITSINDSLQRFERLQ